MKFFISAVAVSLFFGGCGNAESDVNEGMECMPLSDEGDLGEPIYQCDHPEPCAPVTLTTGESPFTFEVSTDEEVACFAQALVGTTPATLSVEYGDHTQETIWVHGDGTAAVVEVSGWDSPDRRGPSGFVVANADSILGCLDLSDLQERADCLRAWKEGDCFHPVPECGGN